MVKKRKFAEIMEASYRKGEAAFLAAPKMPPAEAVKYAKEYARAAWRDNAELAWRCFGAGWLDARHGTGPGDK